MTPLEDSFSCNFNILIAGAPQVLGVRRILEEWTAFRMECVCRRVDYDLKKAKDKLHLLRGLSKNPARHRQGGPHCPGNRRRSRGRPQPDDRLRHRRDPGRICRRDQTPPSQPGIHPQTHRGNRQTGKRRGRNGGNPPQPRAGAGHHRRGAAGCDREIRQAPPQPPPLRLRYPAGRRRDRGGSAGLSLHPLLHGRGVFQENHSPVPADEREQKLKEGDRITQTVEASNSRDLLFFTGAATVYKAKAADFPDTKASVLGITWPPAWASRRGKPLSPWW